MNAPAPAVKLPESEARIVAALAGVDVRTVLASLSRRPRSAATRAAILAALEQRQGSAPAAELRALWGEP